MNNIYKLIYNEIKRYKKIYIARHIGPDPDAFGCQMGLKNSIKLTFPDKEVYAVDPQYIEWFLRNNTRLELDKDSFRSLWQK